MLKELPNYVFNKSYDCFYLLTEFDIIFNTEFTKKIHILLKKNGSDNLSIDLEVPKEYDSLVPKKIEISKKNGLDSFYEMGLDINGSMLSYYMMNFFVHDDSMTWEIYVSLENELSIFACTKEISSLFEIIFTPYAEEDIEQKYKIIGDMFTDKKTRLDFADSLEKNYHFRNNG